MGEAPAPFGKPQAPALAFAQRLVSPRPSGKRKPAEKEDPANRARPFEKWPTVQVLIQKAREMKKEAGSEEVEAHASST